MSPSPSRIQLDEILPEVYSDLRAIASRALDRERTNHSYQTTELVHEAYVRLAAVNQIDWRDPDHILRAAVGVIRRVLIDYARAKKSKKRTPDGVLHHGVESELHSPTPNEGIDILELEVALEKLKQLDLRKAEIVELKYFGGQEIDTIGRLIGVSSTTVKREWSLAKAWLLRELNR